MNDYIMIQVVLGPFYMPETNLICSTKNVEESLHLNMYLMPQ